MHAIEEWIGSIPEISKGSGTGCATARREQEEEGEAVRQVFVMPARSAGRAYPEACPISSGVSAVSQRPIGSFDHCRKNWHKTGMNADHKKSNTLYVYSRDSISIYSE